MSNLTSTQGQNESANANKANASEMDKSKDKESIFNKVKKNVEKLREAKKNSSGRFVKIQPGEVEILQFTGDVEPVHRTFTRKKEGGGEEVTKKIMYAKVLDIKQQDEGIKIWEVSRSWSDSIDNLLVKEFLTLEVKREGAGTNTSYLFAPSVSANTSIKGS